jgi:gamma-glutamyltranspeptidase/glutathione hydrolase
MFGLVQGEANAIQPGKRMLSAMSPTIVLDPDGGLLLVVGARGGPRIITATSQIILDIIDHRMTLADAMSAPRIHHQALPDSLRFERRGLSQVAMDSLKASSTHDRPVRQSATELLSTVRGNDNSPNSEPLRSKTEFHGSKRGEPV